ncbi:hypothetical protein PGT21_005970 [Puccinia graminis f. sp. tritici]|uniref:Uncharacterized protein n=1 Tax=Puccinia graminis f. sp. tritici TaxID=56615 RepID=A0A5B0MDZ8_PUCGR|nr:hypothetical protein PGT21_005970 [Puccinia graminis f. sp. tritici]
MGVQKDLKDTLIRIDTSSFSGTTSGGQRRWHVCTMGDAVLVKQSLKSGEIHRFPTKLWTPGRSEVKSIE